MVYTSFYLNSPKAKSKSPVYISITFNGKRARFPSGESFLISHCNSRLPSKSKKNKPKFLISGMPFYLEYKNILSDITDRIELIELNFRALSIDYDVEAIKDKYISKYINKIEENQIDFYAAFDIFYNFHKNNWSEGRKVHFTQLKSKLKEFELQFKPISLRDFNLETYRLFRDDFLIQTLNLQNNSANGVAKRLRQFLHYGKKQEWEMQNLDYNEVKSLKEAEVFKIALKKDEIKEIIKLNLTSDKKMDSIRDCFLLEVFTAQRYSDVEKILDNGNKNGKQISIIQKKNGNKAEIPMYEDLELLLDKFRVKYPDGFPIYELTTFNLEIKKIGKLAGITQKHNWVEMRGKKSKSVSDFRYNLISSHTGRRTFCTRMISENVDRKIIMRITGHKSVVEFEKYIRVDDLEIDFKIESMYKKEINTLNNEN
jgi:integrase